MKLRSVRTFNINSLKGENFIDFQSGILAETGLFAIIGPTGAGKSTLLDAITLALYNQTPRSGKMSKAAITDFGAIITRSTDEARCEVEYEINGKVYRSMWRISRARTGNLRDYEMELSEQGEDGEFKHLDLKKSLIPDKNSEIIGLSFDQFIKSILLSQGDFARFLKANANERGELLEKITGTEIYRRIGRAAFAKRGEELKQLETLQQKLEGVELLSVEERKEMKEETSQLTLSVKETQKKEGDLQKSILLKKELKHLSKSIEEVTKQLADNTRNITQFQPYQSKLDVHFKVLPLKVELEKLTLNTKNRDSVQTSVKKIDAAVPTLEQEIKIATHTQEQTKGEHKTLASSLEKEMKVWANVREKDQAHAKQLAIVKGAKEASSRSEQEKKAILKELESIIETAKQLEKDRLETLQIQKDLLSFVQLPEMFGELVSLKKQLDTSVRELQSEIEVYPKSSTHNEIGSLQSNTQRVLTVKAALDKANVYIIQKQELIGNQDLEQVQESINKGQEFLGVTEQLQAVVKESVALDKQAKKLNEEHTETQKKHQQHNEDAKQTNNKLELNQARLKEMRARWERQQLEANYEQARTLLKEGEACPLCGSTEHPFVGSYKNTLNETKQQIEALEQTEKAELEQVKKLENAVSTLSARLESDALRVKEFEQKKQQLVERYATLANRINQTPEITDMAVLDHLLERVKQRNAQNKKHLDNFRDLNKAKEKLPVLERLLLFVERVKSCELDMNSKLELFPLKTSDNLKTTFVQLEDKLKEIKEVTERFEKQEKKDAELKVQRREKEKRNDEVDLELNRCQKLLQEEEQKAQSILNERKAVFGDKSVETEEKALRLKIQQVETKLSASEKELASKTSTLTEWQKKLVEEKEKTQQLDKEIQELENQIEVQLLTIGLSSKEKAQEALLEEEEVTKLQHKKERLQQESVKLKQSMEENTKRRDTIVAQELLEGAVADLEKEHANIQQTLNEQQQRVGALNNRMELEKRNRKASKELVEQIDKQQIELNRWTQLNTLIGDATGSRFSKFAQELTLEQLLVLANKHLQPLSDRYLLKSIKVGKDTELFVVDLYHGNEERSVKTLSGGESFLLSLSLALGLSDLAGQNTQIESLFIDEGFGTLDQETLDTALTTLERLQHETNRTIGVISHVQALKERITTQIELKRDSSGYSSLLINA